MNSVMLWIKYIKLMSCCENACASHFLERGKGVEEKLYPEPVPCELNWSLFILVLEKGTQMSFYSVTVEQKMKEMSFHFLLWLFTSVLLPIKHIKHTKYRSDNMKFHKTHKIPNGKWKSCWIWFWRCCWLQQQLALFCRAQQQDARE